MTRQNLTVEQLKAVLDYAPATGEFRWRPRSNNPALTARIAGKIAGHRAGNYWRIRFDGRNHAADRLAWLYVHGRLPKGDVDHRDGDGLACVLPKFVDRLTPQGRVSVQAEMADW